MKKVYLKIAINFFTASLAVPVFAGVTFGDPKSQLGAIIVSGDLRGNYQDKDYAEQAESDQKINFDVAVLNIAYESPEWFGRFEYRCYQYDDLCDFSTLVEAYAGYNINASDNIMIGLQPIPFGPSRYWDSSYYAGINNTMGLQDALNLGINYHFEMPTATKVDLAYFATDGGDHHGNSKDSARYSANVVSSSDPMKTDLNEKNMWMARVDQDLKFLSTDDLKVSVGANYWYSDIKNAKASADGNRKTWAVFNRINYKNLNLSLTGGKQSMNNQDQLNPASSTFGSFDSEYEIANKGYFYTVDSSYTFNNVRDSLNLTPYVVFSGFNKEEKAFNDSQRNIVGVAWDYKNIAFYTEYVMSKNDPFVGGTTNSLARGDDVGWNKLTNLVLVYNF